MRTKRLWVVLVCAIYAASFALGTAYAEKDEVAYYTCGMHPSVKVTPKEYKNGNTQCPVCHMDLVPVYKEKKMNMKTMLQTQPGMSAQKKTAEHKILYYRNPMNPQVTSKVPTKDEMGMEYIPVYADELAPSKDTQRDNIVSRVNIKSEEIALAGVQTKPATKERLYKKIRTVGKVAYDPELATAQEEYLSSLKVLNQIKEGDVPAIRERAANLVRSSQKKLKLLGLSDEQIKDLGKSKKAAENLILPDTKMWIYAEAYEYELGWVKPGETVKVTASSLPGEEFHGVIASVNPVLDPQTRSVTFRVEVDNPDLKLKPEMYVNVIIESTYAPKDEGSAALAIPRDAVLDTGVRKIVWVDAGGGQYEGREVVVGPVATAKINGQEAPYYPVLKGIDEGERVVTKANFLIDSQSQITGVASAAYGGALGAEKKEKAATGQKNK